ncbi:MAG TPA: vanadium-dependent haloperoxidase [Saprospiraceae bacterium]|nr:vanadium-dependent haloperoxidase [Saprospiraceae bacterium]
MKHYLLLLLSIVLLASSCENTDTIRNDADFKHYNADLITDWIDLHLQVVKRTTGVSHIAYSRHFAYTGVALYESLVHGDSHYKSIADQLNGTIDLPDAPQGKPLFWPASANAAVAQMLRSFYPSNQMNLQRIDSLEDAYYAKYSVEVKNETELQKAVTYGQQIAAAVIEWSSQDGADGAAIPYTLLGEGYWEPTPNAFAPANLPGWGNNRTMLSNSISNTLPPAPIAFSVEPGTPFYNMVKEVYDISQTLTDAQKAMATFWDDAPNGQYVTAFGHWFNILKQVIDEGHVGLMKAADAYVRLGITMNDATISVWKTKYTYHQLRPVTYIRKHMGLSGWNSYIGTPPHPEYTAAHATISASAGFALESVFGPHYGFTDHTYDGIGMMPRTYAGFAEAGEEAGLSRLYGGIHYRPSIETGNEMGRKVGDNVSRLLKTRK